MTFQRLLVLGVSACALCLTTSVHAIVLFPNAPAVTDKPHDDVVGRYRGNASAVAVAPNYVITTRHQLGDLGSNVYLGGVQYEAAEIFTYGNADIRLVRLETVGGDDANLTHYVPMYTGITEVTSEGVLGGFGKGRGGVLSNGDVGDYGYGWSGVNNQTQRWGTNIIEGVTVVNADNVYLSQTITFDFSEAPDITTASEAAAAEWDSGGGFFIKDGGVWKVAGLLAYVEHGAERQSWYRGDTIGDLVGDTNYAIRVSSYAAQIQADIIPIPEPASLLTLAGLGSVLVMRRHRKR